MGVGGARVRRVSFLIDMGGGARADRTEVHLLVRRMLTHLSNQHPTAPAWSFRFYDSGLSPHAFDARLEDRKSAAAAAAAAEEERARRGRGRGGMEVTG
jgi:hypothetical protein